MTPPRSALITGGTSGIGLEVATALAGAGHRILTTGRDPDRGAAAEQQLQQAGAAAATFLPTDHSSLAATRELADRVRDSTRTLDLLVLNAGAMPAQRTLTAEGLDLEVAVEVISPVVLVDGLQSLLTGRHGARVLLVTSAAADRASADTRTDPWQGQAYGAGMRAYAHAKRWKLHLAAGLADELAPTGLAVHAVSPGPAWTPMTQALTRRTLGVPVPLWWLVRGVQRLSTPHGAARCLARAALDPTLGQSSRQLISSRSTRPIDVDPHTAHEDLRRARALAVNSTG